MGSSTVRAGKRMPRTRRWQDAYDPANILAVARAKLRGATVSWNQVVMDHSTVERNGIVAHHAYLMFTHVDSYAIMSPYSTAMSAYIGKFAGVAENCTVGALSHPIDHATAHDFPRTPRYGLSEESRPAFEEERTVVGPDAWIGARSIIKGGVRIGAGAVIGSGSVVTKDVEPYVVVAGVPARPLKRRFPEDVAARLLEIAWWDWAPTTLKEHVGLFQVPVSDDVLDRLEEVAASERDGSGTPAVGT